MDPYQNILQKAYDHRFPLTSHFELTYRCNLACVHCYATNHETAKNELNTSECKNVLNELAELNCLFLTLTGGEIFLRDDILEIIQHARSLGFALSLYTNGTLLTKSLVDKIAQIEPLSVEMSLYAVNPETHDRITGIKGSHSKTVSAVQMCRARNIRVAVKSMLMKSNVREFKSLKSFSEELGARFVFDFVLVPTDNGKRPMQYIGLSENDIVDFLVSNFNKTDQPNAQIQHDDLICGAGSNTLCVNPFGDVYPCLAIRKSAGNVRNKTLKEIWSSEHLDQIRNSRYSMLSNCITCQLAHHCNRCSGVALAECRNMFGCSESALLTAKATCRAIEIIEERNEQKKPEK